jgi:hypothetical protein
MAHLATCLAIPRKNGGKAIMRKIALTVLGAALLTGFALQPAAAAGHHHVRKAQRPPVATAQPFRNSNAAIWPGPTVSPDWSRYYHDEALSPPAGH